MSVHTITRQSCHMADQPNTFHATDVTLGKMKLVLSLIVYKQLTALVGLNTDESLEWERGKNLTTVYIVRHLFGGKKGTLQQQKYSEDITTFLCVIWMLKREEWSNTQNLFSVSGAGDEIWRTKYGLWKYALLLACLTETARKKERLHPQKYLPSTPASSIKIRVGQVFESYYETPLLLQIKTS